MSYAIIGLGKIGAAIAQAFASQVIEVAVAGERRSSRDHRVRSRR